MALALGFIVLWSDIHWSSDFELKWWLWVSTMKKAAVIYRHKDHERVQSDDAGNCEMTIKSATFQAALRTPYSSPSSTA